MFAAAATVAQMFFDSAVATAKWLATKTFLLYLIMVVLPWALKPVFIWAFEYIVAYGREYVNIFTQYIGSTLESHGVVLDIQLTGVGGYLASRTGLIEYASIIFSGWGLYWFVCVFSRVPFLR
jgi:hypothetical protein